MQGDGVGNAQLSGDAQRADPQHLDGMGMDQIKALLGQTTSGRAARRVGRDVHPRTFDGRARRTTRTPFKLWNLQGSARLQPGVRIDGEFGQLPGLILGAEHRDLPLIAQVLGQGLHLVLRHPGGTADGLGRKEHIEHQQLFAL